MERLMKSFAALSLLTSIGCVVAFSPINIPVGKARSIHISLKGKASRRQIRTNNGIKRHSDDDIIKLKMSSTDPGIQKMQEQANKMKLEAEKLETELNLEKISKLEAAIKASEKLDDDAKAKKITDIKGELKALASRIDPSAFAVLEEAVGGMVEEVTTSSEGRSSFAVSMEDMAVDTSPKVETQTNLYAKRDRELKLESIKEVEKETITEAELTAAVEYFNTLPKQMRRALAKAIDLNESTTAPAIIVLGLYELKFMLNDEKLKKLYEAELIDANAEVNTVVVSTLDEAIRMIEESNNGKLQETDDPFNPFAYPSSENADEIRTMVENFLPRNTRKEGTVPTLSEVEVFTTNVLRKVGKDTFQQSGKPEQIPGGYIIRGKMASKLKEDGDRLIELLDEEIESSKAVLPEWNEMYQVSYMTDPTPQMLMDDDLNGAPVLVVHSRDMAPSTSALLTNGVSALSLFLTFVFAISIFGQNEVVMQRLTAAQNANDYDLTWFNQLLTPFLIAIGVTQASHEAAHIIVAKKEGFKITPPTVLPLIALPYMSFQNRIKTSPKNLNVLFNFASAGPAVGMVSSMAFLLIGLQMTLTMTPDQLEYAPSVPVGFLQLSSLGANIVDYVLGGGDGIILQQDAQTAVPLHPFAIGGFAGMMINALDAIPLAGTDGGRMSQALLGRPGHVAFSGIVYFSILVYTIFTGHQDIFLSYLFVTSFTQKDLEIPARNDVDQAGLGQAAIALVMWSIAILTLAPLN